MKIGTEPETLLKAAQRELAAALRERDTWRERCRVAERDAAESRVVVTRLIAAIAEHDATVDGYQKPCAAPGAFCECFGVGTLREILSGKG